VPTDLTPMCALTSDSVAAQPVSALVVSLISRIVRRVGRLASLDHRWDLANMLVNDEGRRLATGFRCDFSGYGLNMAGKKNPREWGSIRKQPICCEQATDRCGDDARRQD
jgi:hypothetical protein